MKFEDELIKSEYYTSWKSIPENRRKNFQTDEFLEFKQSLFDLYDVENVYAVDDTLLKESTRGDICILIEISDSFFIDLLDRRSEMVPNNISIICKVRDARYKVTHNNVVECEKPKIEVLLENEKFE